MKTDRIRLCIVMGAHWAAQMGGAQYQVRCLLDAITRHGGFETYYLARLTSSEFSTSDYKIVRFGEGAPLGRARFLTDLLPLFQHLVAIKPSVVYQRGLKPYTGVCAAYAQRYGARLVFHVAHDDDVHRPRHHGKWPNSAIRRIERQIGDYGMRRAGEIVVQTDFQARALQSEYGLRATQVVRNFHPLPESSDADIRDGRRRVIWVANFKPSKRPEIFVDLAELFLSDPSVQFVMIGRPGDSRLYKGLHARIERLANLEYLGELPIERVNAELERSCVFVNTSTAEGFPNTFIQAWARGVPVVSCGVDPDGCLSAGSIGLVARSPERLASVLRELLADPMKLEHISRAARTYARAQHGPEQATALVNLLAQQPCALGPEH